MGRPKEKQGDPAKKVDDCASPRALKSVVGLWGGEHLAIGNSVVLSLPRKPSQNKGTHKQTNKQTNKQTRKEANKHARKQTNNQIRK